MSIQKFLRCLSALIIFSTSKASFGMKESDEIYKTIVINSKKIFSNGYTFEDVIEYLASKKNTNISDMPAWAAEEQKPNDGKNFIYIVEEIDIDKETKTKLKPKENVWLVNEEGILQLKPLNCNFAQLKLDLSDSVVKSIEIPKNFNNSITAVDLTNCLAIENLDFLKRECFNTLENLNLNNCGYLKKLSLLESFSDGKSYTVTGLFSKTISHFGKKAKVLFYNENLDLSFFENLTNLERLYLENCTKLTSLAFLEHLKNLVRLNIHGCEYVQTFEELGNLESLRELDITGIKDVNLSALNAPKKLQRLYAEGVKIDQATISAIAKHTYLRRLELLNSYYSEGEEEINLKELRALTKIKFLNIPVPQSTQSLDFISSEKLERLTLKGENNITDFSQLAKFKKLKYLTIFVSENAKSLEPLKDLKALERITLSGNTYTLHKLELTTQLKELPRLKSVDLTDCRWSVGSEEDKETFAKALSNFEAKKRKNKKEDLYHEEKSSLMVYTNTDLNDYFYESDDED